MKKIVSAVLVCLATLNATFAEHSAKCPAPVNLALKTLGLADEIGKPTDGVVVNETVNRFGYPMVTYSNAAKTLKMTFSTNLAAEDWPWMSVESGNPSDLDLGKKLADIKDAKSEYYGVTFKPDCTASAVMWNHLNMTLVYPFEQNTAGAEFCKNLNAGVMPHPMENFPQYLEYDVKEYGNILAPKLNDTISMCQWAKAYLN